MCVAWVLLVAPAWGQITLYEFDPGSQTYNTSAAARDVNFQNAEGFTWATSDQPRPFSTDTMAPTGAYSGPDFFGGFSADSTSGSFTHARVRHTPNAEERANRRAEVVFEGASPDEPGSTTLFFGAEIPATALKDIKEVIVSGGRTRRANGSHIIHLAVEVDGKWYVGDKIVSNAKPENTALNFTFADLPTYSWTAYTPEDGLLVSPTDKTNLPQDSLIRRLAAISTINWNADWEKDAGGGQLTNLISVFKVIGSPVPLPQGLIHTFHNLRVQTKQKQQHTSN